MTSSMTTMMMMMTTEVMEVIHFCLIDLSRCLSICPSVNFWQELLNRCPQIQRSRVDVTRDSPRNRDEVSFASVASSSSSSSSSAGHPQQLFNISHSRPGRRPYWCDAVCTLVWFSVSSPAAGHCLPAKSRLINLNQSSVRWTVEIKHCVLAISPSFPYPTPSLFLLSSTHLFFSTFFSYFSIFFTISIICNYRILTNNIIKRWKLIACILYNWK